MAEIILLNRIRVDIGNVSGSLSELMQYAGIAGFNDNYEPQNKPRLVGTWTINNWYTTAQLAEAQAAFDGLTIVGDPNYVIDFSQMAVQTLDSTQPNYNPGMAIVLQAAGYGVTFDAPIISGQTGRWMLTKTQASQITNLTGIFKNKASVLDTNRIVSSENLTYAQTYLDFSNFGITRLTNYSFEYTSYNCPLILPSSLNSLATSVFNSCSFHYVHFLSSIPPQNNNSGLSIKCLVGNGNKYNDNTIKNTYQHGSLSNISYKISTWYLYACPQLYYDGTDVTITVERTSTIYYTTDGSTPTEQSTEYTQPFAWDGQGVIKAIAVYNTTHIQDRIAYSEPFYAQTVATPIFTIDTTNNQVTINCATSGAIIHYAIDSYPTLDSPIYSSPITSQEDILKVRCFATAQGYNDSEIVGKIGVLNDSLWGIDGDSSNFAVQCIDSTKPNYNPAVCIILFNNNKLTNACDGGGGGYLTKTGAAAISSISTWFRNISQVSDTQNLIDGTIFTLGTFSEFKYFTRLQSLTEYNGFNRTGFTFIELPSTITSIKNECFAYLPNPITLKFNSTTPPTTDNTWYNTTVSKLYVGNGSSASHDDAILADYQAESTWSMYVSKFDTWYNYLHPTT